jgi:endonuclease III
LQGMARVLLERHGGEVPRTMAELVALPGIGRKTANVILGNAFGVDEGIVVDTHVRRVSNRLGFTEKRDPEKIEQDLLWMVPEEDRTSFSHLLIFHGRRVCKARKPECPGCVLNDVCPSAFYYKAPR